MMNKKLAIGLATFFGSISIPLISARGGWIEVLTPVFVGGLLGQISGLILAVWGGLEVEVRKPNRRRQPETYTYGMRDWFGSAPIKEEPKESIENKETIKK